MNLLRGISNQGAVILNNAFTETRKWAGTFTPDVVYSYDGVSDEHTFSSGGGGFYPGGAKGVAYKVRIIGPMTFIARIKTWPSTADFFGIRVHNPNITIGETGWTGFGIGHRYDITSQTILYSQYCIRDNIGWQSTQTPDLGVANKQAFPWLKLEFGNTGTQAFYTFFGADGINWTRLGTETRQLNGNQPWDVGGVWEVGLYGDTNGNPVVFDNLSIT